MKLQPSQQRKFYDTIAEIVATTLALRQNNMEIIQENYQKYGMEFDPIHSMPLETPEDAKHIFTFILEKCLTDLTVPINQK